MTISQYCIKYNVNLTLSLRTILNNPLITISISLQEFPCTHRITSLEAATGQVTTDALGLGDAGSTTGFLGTVRTGVRYNKHSRCNSYHLLVC